MPELPEVETIRRGLSEQIIGFEIVNVTQKTQNSVIFGKEAVKFKTIDSKNVENEFEKKKIADKLKNLIGNKVKNTRRFGKMLVIDLDGGNSILVHLRMTGQLIITYDNNKKWGAGHPNDAFIKEHALPDNSTRVVIEFRNEFSKTTKSNNNAKLYFNDQRKFGFMQIVPTIDVENVPFIRSLGPEPPTSQELFLHNIRKHNNTNIKAALLNQKIVAGIGNIYADEALFLSKIHPNSHVKDLSDNKLLLIYKNAAKIMKLSITHGGSTMSNYVDVLGNKGAYLEFANVFGRNGKHCKVCETIIEKIRVSGRGTHFCPNCQKL